MDYKERIEAAKEQMKAADAVEYKLPDSAHAIRTAVYAIYPELRESEDERIRKEILQSIRDNMVVIHKDECIAWLEKQVSPDIVADAYLRGCNDTEKKLLEKQGEQKSINYNEELKKCRENPLYFFDKYVKLEERKSAWNEEDMKEALRTEYEKGRADAFAQIQKEWSKEDEKMFNFCCEYLDDTQEDWLKSIKQRIGG